ncbi:hypothetical protein AGMMS49940_22300 [Spirochaetia bacterium]|nr:hypothetical protein AGMMS49940_22300 [Spirochaetia bacterium]
MKMKSTHVLFVSLVVTFLSSCASAPKVNVPAASGGEFAALAPGAQVYFYADVTRALPILAQVSLTNVNMKQTLGLLEKVDFLSGAVYPKGQTRNMLFHAWRRRGRIPGGGLLALSNQWKKTASSTGAYYWHSSAYGLSVSIQKTQVFVSDGDPFIDGPPITAPEKLAELRQIEDLPELVSGWLENAGIPVNNFLSTLGLPVRIPLERILFAIHELADPANQGSSNQGSLYEASLRIETQNASQARALTSILALIRGITEGAAPGADQDFLGILRPLLANPPEQDGSDLLIRTGPLSAEAIALLLNRFAAFPG